MPTGLTIGDRGEKTVLAHRVYTREEWTDPWTERPEVHCTSATWAASPSYPEASLYYRYGYGRLPGDTGYGEYARFTLPTLAYVMIEFDVFDLLDLDATPTIKRWHGLAGTIIDSIDGGEVTDSGGTALPSGYQTFRCVGFDWLLDREYLITAQLYGSGNPVADAANSAPAFGKNRKPSKISGSWYFDQSASAVDWTTESIVEYLLDFAAPSFIVWKLGTAISLPDFDAPKIEAHGYPVGAILKRLISRQRGYGYVLKVDAIEDSGDDAVELIPFTFTESAVLLTGTGLLSANPTQYDLTMSADHGGGLIIVNDAFARFHRVRVVGARARCVFSVIPDPAWESADETAYIDGASNEVGYPSAGESDLQNELNIAARSASDLAPVYRDFKIDIPNWFYQTHDGENALPIVDADPTDLANGAFSQYEYPFLPGKRFLTELPLAVGVDYTSGPTPAEPDDPEYLPPLCFFEGTLNGSTEFIDSRVIESYGDSTVEDGFDWSAEVRINSDRDLVLSLVTRGRPRHVIDSANIAAPTWEQVDVDQFVPHSWDYSTAVFTVAIEQDHYCEYAETSTAAPPVDLIREMLINVGPSYQLNRAALGTVIPSTDGLSPTTTINETGYLRDDRDALKPIASLALQWYGVDRASVEFQTSWINDNLQVGDLITTIVSPGDDFTVNSPITAVMIEIPIAGAGGPLPVPKMAFKTSFAELDVIRGGF